MLGEGRWKPTEQQREKPEPITLRLGQGQGPSQDRQERPGSHDERREVPVDEPPGTECNEDHCELLKRGKHPNPSPPAGGMPGSPAAGSSPIPSPIRAGASMTPTSPPSYLETGSLTCTVSSRILCCICSNHNKPKQNFMNCIDFIKLTDHTKSHTQTQILGIPMTPST